jgi:hypothetical protein
LEKPPRGHTLPPRRAFHECRGLSAAYGFYKCAFDGRRAGSIQYTGRPARAAVLRNRDSWFVTRGSLKIPVQVHDIGNKTGSRQR